MAEATTHTDTRAYTTKFSKAGRERKILIANATRRSLVVQTFRSAVLPAEVHAMAKRRPQRRWVRTVKTDSTHPPSRTFAGSASQIAHTMARKDVSPKGLGSAIRMIQYFINRGGRRLSASRRRELERAKHILQKRRQSAG